LANFNNFWHATLNRNFTQMTLVLAPHFNTVATLPCKMQKVVVWPFTTMNSYWIAHASAQKWLTANRIGNYCIIKSHTCYITSCAQNVFLQHECKLQTLTPLANSRFN